MIKLQPHIVPDFMETRDDISLQSFQEKNCKNWAPPGFEPGTSRTLSENHTPRPKSRYWGLKVTCKNCRILIIKICLFSQINSIKPMQGFHF